MAEPLTVTIVGGSMTLAALAASASVSDLVQGVDAYLSLADPAAGCSLDAEPFGLSRPAKTTEPAPAERSRELRPEGAKRSARVDALTTPAVPAPGKAGRYPLLRVSDEATVADKVLSMSWPRDPFVNLDLDAWTVGDKIVCLPLVTDMYAFDTRIGHQLTIKCRVTAIGETAATIVTEVLFNPFMEKAGLVTLFHHVSVAAADSRLSVNYLEATVAPPNVFTVDKSWSAPHIKPKK